MPFLAEEHIEVPTTDLLSWMFDRQVYDADKPVMMLLKLVFAAIDENRSMSMLQSQHVHYPQTRQEV